MIMVMIMMVITVVFMMSIDMEKAFALCSCIFSTNAEYSTMLCNARAIDVGQAYDLILSPMMFSDNIGAIALHRYHTTPTNIL